jgi:hypothetical protein
MDERLKGLGGAQRGLGIRGAQGAWRGETVFEGLDQLSQLPDSMSEWSVSLSKAVYSA